MKDWIIGLSLTAGIGIAAPFIRKWIKNWTQKKITDGMISLLAIKLINGNEKMQAQFDKVRHEIIVMAEMLLPDEGMGPDRKQFVIDMFPKEFQKLVSDIIDDDVKLLDEKLKEAVKATEQPDTNQPH